MLLKRSFKYILTTGLILISLYYISINLGFYFDITKKEKNHSLIVCLGGGKGERINKTIRLYHKYSKYNPLILITENNKININKKLKFLEENNISSKNIIYTKQNNTYEELFFMSKLMKNKNLKSVNIISDEPHSRRIKMLMENFIINNNSNIIYNIVGSNVKWWNKKYYYKNKRRAIYFVTIESIKIIHNYFYYNYVEFFNIDRTKNNTYNVEKQKFIKSINKVITYILTF